MYNNKEKLKEIMEEVYQLLAGYFHQDIESPEEALEEFIKESSIECIIQTVKECEYFLHTTLLTKEEKERFIEDSCDIYFPAIQLTPIEFLEHCVTEMKKSLLK